VCWRINETYIKIKGEWKYLYRAVDKQGNTIDFLLAAKRDTKAARRLLTRFEELCTDPVPRMEAIFRFLGPEFSEEYLAFSPDHFVYGNTVSTAYLQPYRDTLSDKICEEILDGTINYHQWHYQP
jgi:hypothetical protein